MPPRLFPYAFLLSVGLISTLAIQDLRLYPDLIPDLTPEKLALKLERLLKLQNQNVPYGSRPFPHLDDFGIREQNRREFERQTLQDVLSEKSSVIHKRRQQHIPNYPPSRVAADGLEDDPTLREYAERNPGEFYSYFQGYPGEIRPLTDAKPSNQNSDYPTIGYRAHHQAPAPPRDLGMKEMPLMDILDRENQEQSFTGRRFDDGEDTVADFTYRFEAPSQRIEELQFALRPNDLGYDTPPEAQPPAHTGVSSKVEDEGTEKILPNEEVQEDGKTEEEEEEDTEQNPEDSVTQLDPFEENEAPIGFERRADNHSPLVTAVDPKISNDIYFVAVVAGCSAAAMFILVLISLTWCRLQRGAKAAADVEYPAYGVTGPNKDTSPSGDRRLAQSAQMYHYQHQKQQIIAMESRTATARDPGSVSEAESDEENEEGDYTVYECPGLAPTGEMEVKNPLFHDDPTPATPAGQGQKNRSSEDHM